jgi:hypothetical protein
MLISANAVSREDGALDTEVNRESTYVVSGPA